jgi:hypothetical protein
MILAAGLLCMWIGDGLRSSLRAMGIGGGLRSRMLGLVTQFRLLFEHRDGVASLGSQRCGCMACDGARRRPDGARAEEEVASPCRMGGRRSKPFPANRSQVADRTPSLSSKRTP